MKTKKVLRLSAPVGECFIMARLGIERLRAFTEAELKVLIYIAEEGTVDPARLGVKLGMDQIVAESAVASLTEEGLIDLGETKVKRTSKNMSSQYDSEDLADAVDEDDGFKAVAIYVGEILQKQLNRNDLNTLYALYDYHGMGAEMICGIVEYCVSLGKRNLSYVFNTAVGMQADGISSFDELEGYLKAKRTADSKAARFRRLCGIGNRELTAKERSYTDRWFGEMRLSFDLVKKAYEITIDRIGELKLPYMSKIIEQWFAKGVRTVEDAEKLQAKHAEDKAAERAEENSEYDIEKFFTAAAKKGFIKDAGGNADSEPADTAEGEDGDMSGEQ
ncbi:MAG: DnaD domain protein [Clostridia bacterium]|nr:DnaD domain protein [Clostridia bacterium]